MVGLDPDWTRIGVDMAQFLATGLVGVYVWFSDRAKARASAMREMEQSLDERLDRIGQRLARMEAHTKMTDPKHCVLHTARLTKVEEAVRHAPNKGDIERAHIRMDALAEGLAELRGGIKRIESQLSLISDHLLNHSNRTGAAR